MKPFVLLKLSVILFLTVFSSNIKAQTTLNSISNTARISAGIELALPLNTVGKNYDLGLGFSLQADVPVRKNLFITLNGGYNNFYAKGSKNPQITTYDLQLLPVKAGLKYLFKNRMYAQWETGASFVLNSELSVPDNKVAVTYAPQIGKLFTLHNNHLLDIGLRFEGNSKFYKFSDHNNFIGLHTAYSLQLR